MTASPFIKTCLPGAMDSPFAQVSEVLPKLGITKRRLKRVESICLIREQRAIGRKELAFNARPFVLCGLPLRRPSSTQLVHRRRNGKFFLHVVGHPDYGLPFGQDHTPLSQLLEGNAPKVLAGALLGERWNCKGEEYKNFDQGFHVVFLVLTCE